MPTYEYECIKCAKLVDIDKPMAQSKRVERCDTCSSILQRILSDINITGTKDGFGIGKAFVDRKSGETIDTYKKWEKAGYSDPLQSPAIDSNIKQDIKRKIDKCKNFDTGKRRHYVA